MNTTEEYGRPGLAETVARCALCTPFRFSNGVANCLGAIHWPKVELLMQPFLNPCLRDDGPRL